MTTIAFHYEDKQIAVDGRCTAGGIIMSETDNKIDKKDDFIFVLAGSVSDKEHFVKDYPELKQKQLDINGIVIEKGVAYSLLVEEEKIFKSEINYNDAFGSGFRFALEAMDLGKSARGSIEYTMTRDIYTGGKIQVIDVETGNVI